MMERLRRLAAGAAVEANKRAVELSDQLYRSGLADFQRVLDSQKSLLESEENLAASDQSVTQALIRVYKSLGGGWEAEEAQEVKEAGDRAGDGRK
jgi:outer membrane protein TolC